jgi:hypothetical protein
VPYCFYICVGVRRESTVVKNQFGQATYERYYLAKDNWVELAKALLSGVVRAAGEGFVVQRGGVGGAFMARQGLITQQTIACVTSHLPCLLACVLRPDLSRWFLPRESLNRAYFGLTVQLSRFAMALQINNGVTELGNGMTRIDRESIANGLLMRFLRELVSR